MSGVFYGKIVINSSVGTKSVQEKESIISVRYGWANLSLGSLFGITRQSLGSLFGITRQSHLMPSCFRILHRLHITLSVNIRNVNIVEHMEILNTSAEGASLRDAKTMTLGTDLSICTSHSCQILI